MVEVMKTGCRRQSVEPCRLRVLSGRFLKSLVLVHGLLVGTSMSGAQASGIEDWQVEYGVRYWYSTGQSRKDLYDNTGALLISRLTYDNLTAHSGELYLRMDNGAARLFIKGYVGLGGAISGGLRDEDFEPVIWQYSSTYSAQDNGWIGYASLDIGYSVAHIQSESGPSLRLGTFVGYHYYREKLNAYGCRQMAANPFICGYYTIPETVKVITQDNDWHSLRLGMVADVQATDRLRLTLDAAYTYSWLDGKDHHWLRPSINPVPEDGDGHGFQLEGLLSYRIADGFEIGIGGRYWQFGRMDAKAHFEKTPGGGITQQEKWKTKRYGVFLQAGWRF